MLATLRSAAVFGVEAYPVHIEVDVSFGLPHFTMVGLPDATVRESRDRVRSAIRNSGFEFPHHRITVNLAPADVRKAGSSFDLPIALGLLATSGPLTRQAVDDTVIVGELSLDGAINAIRGVLPIAVAARRFSAPGSHIAGQAQGVGSVCQLIRVGVRATVPLWQQLGNPQAHDVHHRLPMSVGYGRESIGADWRTDRQIDSRRTNRYIADRKQGLSACDADREHPGAWSLYVTCDAREHSLHLGCPAARSFAEQHQGIAGSEPLRSHTKRLSRRQGHVPCIHDGFLR